MIPLRLVIDTNVVVSAALKPEGLQRTVVLLAMAKPARWYVSDPIVSEYAMVLALPELKIRRGMRQQLLQLIKNHTRVVTPSRVPQVTSDPDDNIFVECADAAALWDDGDRSAETIEGTRGLGDSGTRGLGD